MEHVIEILRDKESILANKIARMKAGKALIDSKSKLREIRDAIRLLSNSSDEFEYMKGYNQALRDCQGKSFDEEDLGKAWHCGQLFSGSKSPEDLIEYSFTTFLENLKKLESLENPPEWNKKIYL